MQQQPMKTRSFCFWDAKSEGDTFILIANSSMALVILFVSAYRLLNLLRFDGIDREKRRTLLQIHGFIFAWAIMFLIENAYAITYFYSQLHTPSPPDDISEPSKAYAVLDKVPSFLVRTIFLKICLFHYNGFMSRMQAKNFSTKQIKFFKWFIIYYWGRILIQVVGILGFLIFEQEIWTISTINVVIVLLDGLLTCFAQVASLIIFTQKCELLDRMEEDDKAKLKRQYYIMIATGLIGFFVNLIFLIIRPLFGDIGKCIEPFEDHLPFSITHNIVGLFILNFTPLIWILKMYSYIRHKSIIVQSSQMSSEAKLLD